MKNHFIGLFNYDNYANRLILSAIPDTANSGEAVKLMAHLLAARQVWLNRCKGLPQQAIELWPENNINELTTILTENHKNWITFLENCRPGDFEKTVVYKTTKGIAYTNKLCDILTHVINHGTHHRAQAGQQLKMNGLAALPGTDYILYLRQLNSQP